MDNLLLFSIIFICFALLSYSISIWSARKSKEIKLKHIILSFVGLLCDSTGTILMTLLAGKWNWNLHGITGALAIFLMLINAIWVTYAYYTKKEAIISNYLKYSLVIWIIWLIPFFGGMVITK